MQINFFVLKKSDIIEIKKRLEQPQKIGIITHYNPDGDALGAALSLSQILKKQHHQVSIMSPNGIPSFLKWMPDIQSVTIAAESGNECRKIIDEADILFFLDFNSYGRTGYILEPLCKKSQTFNVLIDHHICPEIKANIVYSKTKVSSTSELIYDFIANQLKWKDKITKDVAVCLYVGIITDTGSLSYNCDYASTFKALSALMKYGIDGENIHRKIYDNYAESRVRLLGFSLLNRMKVFKDIAVSYIWLSQKDLQNFDYQIGDTEGFVNFGLSMSHVKFTALIIERQDRIKLSFRSKGNFDVNKFARTHFKGGGHRNAAGADSYTTLEETINTFEQILPLYKNELK